MPNCTPEERRLQASLASSVSWANTADRSARTASARAAFDQRFLDQAGGDPVRAKHLRDAYYKRLSLQSMKARRLAKQAREDVVRFETEATAAEALLNETAA